MMSRRVGWTVESWHNLLFYFEVKDASYMPKFIDLTGKTFGRLTVTGRSVTSGGNKHVYWGCNCQCGSSVTVSGSNLTTGNTKSCGCLATELLSAHEDLTGKIYGRLVVLKEFSRSIADTIMWLCKCSCGSSAQVVASGNSLKTGNTKSCGCYRKEVLSKKWEPTDCEDYYEIPLSKGQYAKIDKKDLSQISEYGWSVSAGYAVARAKEKGNLKSIRMSRLILGLSSNDERMADHINHDTLDNRRANLRIVSRSGNSMNSVKRRSVDGGKPLTSRYIGVSFDKRNNKYSASVKINGKRIFLGQYCSEDTAATVRDEAAKQISECYRLNF